MDPQDSIPPEKPNKASYFEVIYKAVIGLSIICVITYFVYEAFQSHSKSRLKLDLGGYIVEVDINNDYVDLNSIISKLFETENSRIQTQALLREYYKLYDLNDPQLVKYIEIMDQQAFLSEELRELLIDLKGPFKRELHSFHDVTNIEIAEAIKDLGFSHSVSEALRKLLKHREGPFEEVEKNVEIRLSKDNQLKDGYASACRKNFFFDKEILIFNEKRERCLSLFVNNAIPFCTDTESESVIEISRDDLTFFLDKTFDHTASYKATAVVKID